MRRSGFVKPRWAKLLGCAAVGVATVGAIRLAFVAAHTEVGWESVYIAWQDATLGWLGLGHKPVDATRPEEQAQFWLAEVDRIVTERGESAGLCMGAAWALDSPGVRWMLHHVTYDPILGLQADGDAIAANKRRFEVACQKRCLALAERATTLEPGDVRWWRMRALLQFQGDDLTPRGADWLATLDAGADHDPDNALYDYLAALALWTQGAEYDMPIDEEWPLDQWRLTVKDAAKFEQGIDHWNRAQSKRYLAIGELGLPAVAQFVGLSRIPKSDQAEIAVSRLITYRHSILFYQVWRWLSVRADRALQTDGTSPRVALLRQQLRLFEQAVTPNETSALDKRVNADTLRRRAFDTIRAASTNVPSLLSGRELEAIVVDERNLRFDAQLVQLASAEVNTARQQAGDVPTAIAILANAGIASAATAIIIAFLAILGGWLVGPRKAEVAGLGRAWHLGAWLLGYSAVFVVLGLAPAEVIPRTAQQWVAFGLAWLVVLATAVWCGRWLFRFFQRRQFQFHLATLMAVVAVVAILLAAGPLIRVAGDEWIGPLVGRLPEASIQARSAAGVDSDWLRQHMQLPRASWTWAAVQWVMYAGPNVGVLASLVVVALIVLRRAARASGEPLVSYRRRDVRRRWTGLFRCLRQSAMAAGICFLLVYLWTAPVVIRAEEAEFQYKMRYCRDPAAHYREFREARARKANSPEAVQSIEQLLEGDLQSGD